jgi:methylenetetrahydrofolate reductase (NADPH)
VTTSSDAAAWDPSTALVVADLLRRPRYEVLALPGTADEVAQHLPHEVTVTVTVGARHGLEATIALSEELARDGYRTVPHLAARLVRDRHHLTDLRARLVEAGIDEVFVVGGDADPPVGEFTEAAQLLRAGRGWGRVGVAAYPEGHPKIDDHELDRALLDKRPMCDYAVTQMCFDPSAVRRWLRHARGLGFGHPVHAGVPGPVDTIRLARVASRIGVGQSLRYAFRQRGGARLLRPGGYRPDGLVADVASDGIAGLHFYTLGDVAATEQWRHRIREQLADA